MRADGEKFRNTALAISIRHYLAIFSAKYDIPRVTDAALASLNCIAATGAAGHDRLPRHAQTSRSLSPLPFQGLL